MTKHVTKYLRVAAARIEGGRGGCVAQLSCLCHVQKEKRGE